MTIFSDRYAKLNEQQRKAVDHIDGPLLVIAGPGTGKTELLSMRAANILQKTDVSPNNILCLTFTESGAQAMRQRLSGIIGADAYKVSIHTFHSFGTEVINQNSEYFYHGSAFRPADEISAHEILTEIFDELSHSNILASKMGDSYTYLSDTVKTISELKRSGLTSDELLSILAANDELLDMIEPELSAIFAGRISTTMLTLLAPIAERVARTEAPGLPPGITPLANMIALSMARAFDDAVETGKTTPITQWRNEWMEKNSAGEFVFKDRKRNAKLRVVAHVYFTYAARLRQESLYDYDDMIMDVIHAMEQQPELRLNLQEKYQYIMVDEFQDTNLAQLRILLDLIDNPATEGQPNVMAVGDDDQAIYSFQGASTSNITTLRQLYPNMTAIPLVDNYRSGANILTAAREVIVQSESRLENVIPSLDKTLTPHIAGPGEVALLEYTSTGEEKCHIAKLVRERIDSGVRPCDIAVIARRHHELVSLLPYLHDQNVAVNYERRENVLENPVIQAIELVAAVIIALHESRHDLADSLMPQLLSHPAFAYSPESIWKLSVTANRGRQLWMEVMSESAEFQPLHTWLIKHAAESAHRPLEPFVDTLVGAPASRREEDEFTSPLYDYYFAGEQLREAPETYLEALTALQTIRTKLREFRDEEPLHVVDFLDFLQTHRDIGSTIINTHKIQAAGDAVTLMTAHKSKGLEYDHVYVYGATDSMWGERARSRSPLIPYPQNLQNVTTVSDSYDERVRLFFVAMTRAKHTLTMSYATSDDSAKPLLPAGFFAGTSLKAQQPKLAHTIETATAQAETSWRNYLTDHPTRTMKDLLAPLLETYKLSATHLNSFVDITTGGPQSFLTNNLLRFPQAKSPSASYGTAIHVALQRAHAYYTAHQTRRPVEDILGDFETELANHHLDEREHTRLSQRGADALTKFLAERYDSFRTPQRTELNFAGQGVVLGSARLTGALDLVDIHDSQIVVTDYKTGSPSSDWKGKSDYEKIKLHRYRQQLMFYQLLVENSRDYSKYMFDRGVLQFVEPSRDGRLYALEAQFTDEELDRFRALIQAVWSHVMILEFPDTSAYEQNLKGVLAFEQALIDGLSLN